jgi:hypothetical protein
VLKVVQVFSSKKMAKDLSRRHPDRGPDYWARYFIPGWIIRPPQDFGKTAKDLSRRHPDRGADYLAEYSIPGRIIRPPQDFSETAKDLARRHPGMGPDYFTGYFIPGQIIRPLKNLEEKRLRAQLGVTQEPGRIIGPDISLRAR